MEKYLNNYLTIFEKIQQSLNGNSVSELNRLRIQAFEKFKSLGFPTTKNEDWKYTNVSPLLEAPFIYVGEVKAEDELTEKYRGAFSEGYFAAIVNGTFIKHDSSSDEMPEGIIFDSLSSQLEKNNTLVTDYLGKICKIENGFTALNTACITDGVMLFIPDNTTLEKPLIIFNLSGSLSGKFLVQPRNLIIAGDNSKAEIFEVHLSLHDNECLVNSVTEIICGNNSDVKIYRLQNENNKTIQINLTESRLNSSAVYSHYSFTFGGKLVRNDTNIVLKGENATGNLYGLYIINDTQHVDNHTLIDHSVPNCQSNELYKGILKDSSRAVFNGKVFVRKDAQKTNAYQSNKAILLSDDARIDTKPQLEIFADDVKCSHGAAIGQLDKDAMFYLRSRGIDENKAGEILLRAFADEVIDFIQNKHIHGYLDSIINAKINS